MSSSMRSQKPRDRFHSDGVATVSPERLVVMLYERLLRDLDDAEAGLVNDDPARTHEALLHGQSIVEELAFAVRPDDWEGGASLLGLYEYVLDRLVQANVTKTAEPISAARDVVDGLHRAWRDAYRSLQPAMAREAG